MWALTKGKYRVRLAETHGDLLLAQRLRALAFSSGDISSASTLDQDEFDSFCDHVLIEELQSGHVVSSFRILRLESGAEIENSYSAKFYDLSALKSFDGPMVEVGRFCIHPNHSDPDLLRVAWAAITKYVDETQVELLFGCSSFKGTDADSYSDAFAILRDRHLAPKRWLPRVKAPRVFPFASRIRRQGDTKRAMDLMPPLLKTYLQMGGWVSDHAVIDQQMNTLHVFTGVEIRSIPAARKRLLRALVGSPA